MIDSSALLDAHKGEITTVIQAKVTLGVEPLTAPSYGNQKQQFLEFPNYIQRGQTESNMIVSQKHSALDRLRCIAMLARKAGCNYPTEETKALMTACAFHDATPEVAMLLGGDMGYNMLSHFKRFFNSTVVVVGGRHPISYPGFETFEAQHTVLFSAAGFVPGIFF